MTVVADPKTPTKTGRYLTQCLLLVGNGRLDVAAGETCDPGKQPATAVDSEVGWRVPTAMADLWKVATPRVRVDVVKLWALGKDKIGLG